MRCYNHPQINAVATCKVCNKHLCKECYDRGHKGLCQDCLVDKRNETKQKLIRKNRIDHLTFIKRSLIASLIGLIFGIAICIAFSQMPEYAEELRNAEVPIITFYTFIIFTFSYVFFAYYSGFFVLHKSFRIVCSWGIILIIGWPVLLFLCILAVLIGVYLSIPIFTYHVFKYFTGKRKVNRSTY